MIEYWIIRRKKDQSVVMVKESKLIADKYTELHNAISPDNPFFVESSLAPPNPTDLGEMTVIATGLDEKHER